ncbi:hypothetical protein Pmani_008337 [Petrolisthes manimaculis]|uniref:Uncharacterized protein n=1 Tax=Petrolisthes manimaculis TaxID=1843537 RepID=A0AAE1UJ25_9EUCA|nr:hypothetical protein Pmani_008337 [Petrolisthes manimaculis]
MAPETDFLLVPWYHHLDPSDALSSRIHHQLHFLPPPNVRDCSALQARCDIGEGDRRPSTETFRIHQLPAGQTAASMAQTLSRRFYILSEELPTSRV